MTASLINHDKGYSLIHKVPLKKRVYNYTSVGITVEDRIILKQIAKERGIHIHFLLHELTILAFKQHSFKDQMPHPMPEEFKKLFSIFDEMDLLLARRKMEDEKK
jgi:hypothetical protein